MATERNWCRRLARIALPLSMVCSLALPAQAQGLIRDAEVENTLRMISKPLLQSAGRGLSSIEFLIINDPTLNAFVIDNKHIFLHSGIVTRLESVDMLQSVIAHELAHITNGHLVQRRLNQQSASTAAGLGLLMSVIVGAASGSSEAAAGLALGATSAAQRNYLAHTRAEEASADQSGARFMVLSGIDPAAFVKVLEIFKSQESTTGRGLNPYAQSHPLSPERIRVMRSYVRSFDGRGSPPPDKLVYWHKRMVAKLDAFLHPPQTTLRRINSGDNSEFALLRRAVAYHRLPDSKKAISNINALLSLRPDDPYYQELKGQILLESRRFAAAIAPYERAVELLPDEPLILAGLGKAYLALNTKSGNKRALETLRDARQQDPRDQRMLRDLAMAYARGGDNGMASLMTAERYALVGRFQDAQTHAIRAEDILPHGSAGWLQAQDIQAAVKIALRKK